MRAHIALDGDERNPSKSFCTPVKNHLEVQAGHVDQLLQRKDPQLDWSSDRKGSEKLFEVVSEWVLAADQAIYQERVPSSGNQQELQQSIESEQGDMEVKIVRGDSLHLDICCQLGDTPEHYPICQCISMMQGIDARTVPPLAA